MKSKYLLFTGIISLSLGIVLKATNQLENFGLSLIIIGVAFKVIYIVNKFKNGEYKPGIELFALGLGLFLFFIGLYCLDPEHMFLKPIYFIVSGITLKIIFIVRFIQIIRSRK